MAKNKNTKRTPAKQQELRENYKRLRDAGFSTQDAARLRSASNKTIAESILSGQRKELSERHQAAGKGQTWTEAAINNRPKVHKGRIGPDDYKEVEKGETYMYNSRYTYLMTFKMVKQDGEYKWQYCALQSPVPMTKREMKEQIIELYDDPDQEGDYQWYLVHSSIALVQAFYRSDWKIA